MTGKGTENGTIPSPKRNYSKRGSLAGIENEVSETEMTPPKSTREMRGQTVDFKQRPFICWDGEGMNLSGRDKPQHYVLFGCSTQEHIVGKNLSTNEILDFILDVGERNPNAIHIGFAFNYDVNMILRDLPRWKLEELRATRQCYLRNRTLRIEWLPSKSFRVTRYTTAYRDNVAKRSRNRGSDYTSVTIYDVFSFFQKSFVAVCEEYLKSENDIELLEIVRDGKAMRNDFQWDELEYVRRYWTHEIELLARLMAAFRPIVFGAEFYIKQWHGPGVLANYAFNGHGTSKLMNQNHPEPVRKAAQHAYAGGRFELFKMGHYDGPVWSLDINSAYPYAISQLPSFGSGEWVHVVNPDRPKRFGVYRCRFRHSNIRPFMLPPGPAFYRAPDYTIHFPWSMEGWYWTPEVVNLLQYPGDVEILEGWEFTGTDRAFPWLPEMYRTRQEWKAKGWPAEKTLKLAMNSLYGKMAQRVGWDEKHNRPPKWHQLEWAGYTTSLTRHMLYSMMLKIGLDNVIAVETDGIYVTVDPATLGIETSKELGGWEIEKFDQMVYLQSGVYWARQGTEWKKKTRGLNKDSMHLPDVMEYLSKLKPGEDWSPIYGVKTEFTTIGQALMDQSPAWRSKWCRWTTQDRAITPGEKGKRLHITQACRACKQGMTPYEGMHDLVVGLSGGLSTPHSLPWVAKEKDSGDVSDFDAPWWHELVDLEREK